MSRATPTGLSVASAWKVTLYAPASAYGGAQRSGSSIIRWQSIGMSVLFSNASTTGSPMVRFGTKWLSITSTCSQSAPVTAATSSPSSAKSAARIDGAMRGPAMRSPYCESRGEHRIGAVPVWPELHVRSVAEIVDRIEQRPGVQRGDRVAAQRIGDDADGLHQMRRTRRVQHHAAGTGQPDRRRQQLALQLRQRRHVAGLAPPAGFR